VSVPNFLTPVCIRTNQLNPIDFTTVPNLSCDDGFPAPTQVDEVEEPLPVLAPATLEQAASDIDNDVTASTVIRRDLFMTNLS
jgi:hypothetical protein